MAYDKEINMYTGYIYCITNLINGKVYIGQTITTVQHRMGQHIAKRRNKNAPVIDKAINKYGKENFKIEQLIKIIKPSKKELKDALNIEERFCIDWYESLCGQNGYNVDFGGSSNNSIKNPVDVYDYYGNYIRSFESCLEAGIYYNISDVCVGDICRGKSKRCMNPKVVFRYKGDDFDKYDVFLESEKVYQFSLDGELLNVFNTMDEAEEYIGRDRHRIFATINDTNAIAYGYYWCKNGKFEYNEDEHWTNIQVDKYSIDGKYIDTYYSLSKAALSVDRSRECGQYIKKNCTGEILHPVFGYVWRFKGEPFNKYQITETKEFNKTAVDMYSLDGMYITTYESFIDACRQNDINERGATNISAVCKGRKLTAYGYVWRLRGESFDKYRTPDKSKIITNSQEETKAS